MDNCVEIPWLCVTFDTGVILQKHKAARRIRSEWFCLFCLKGVTIDNCSNAVLFDLHLPQDLDTQWATNSTRQNASSWSCIFSILHLFQPECYRPNSKFVSWPIPLLAFTTRYLCSFHVQEKDNQTVNETQDAITSALMPDEAISGPIQPHNVSIQHIGKTGVHRPLSLTEFGQHFKKISQFSSLFLFCFFPQILRAVRKTQRWQFMASSSGPRRLRRRPKKWFVPGLIQGEPPDFGTIAVVPWHDVYLLTSPQNVTMTTADNSKMSHHLNLLRQQDVWGQPPGLTVVYVFFVDDCKYRCCPFDLSPCSKLNIETDSTSWAPPNMTNCDVLNMPDIGNITVTAGERKQSLRPVWPVSCRGFNSSLTRPLVFRQTMRPTSWTWSRSWWTVSWTSARSWTTLSWSRWWRSSARWSTSAWWSLQSPPISWASSPTSCCLTQMSPHWLTCGWDEVQYQRTPWQTEDLVLICLFFLVLNGFSIWQTRWGATWTSWRNQSV